MKESSTPISMLIFGVETKSFITRMFKSNSGEPYAGKLHVRFLEEFISNCLIISEGEKFTYELCTCICLFSFYQFDRVVLCVNDHRQHSRNPLSEQT